jgi:peptide/nickel transport system permease protein
MGRYVIRRLLSILVVIAILTFLTFVIYFELPPNNSIYEVFTHGQRTARASALTRQYLGLNLPFPGRYLVYVRHLVLGDRYGWPGFWYSFQTRSALKPIIAARAVVTAQLAIGAAIIWLAVGLPLGIVSALRPRTRADRISMGFAVLGVSTPVFFVGSMLLYVFWFKLGIAGSAGYVPIDQGVDTWISHMILPWITLAIPYAAFYSRMARGSLIESLGEDYIRTARAKGVAESRIVARHALRASLIPLLMMFGMDLGSLFGGAIIVETIFNLPGLGSLAVTSIQHDDLYALADITLVVCVAIAFMNLAVDLVHAAVDPRVRYARMG